MTNKNDQWSVVKQVGVEETMLDVPLRPKDEYRFRVRAENDAGQGPPSEELLVKMALQTEEPSAPGRPTATFLVGNLSNYWMKTPMTWVHF